MRGLIQAIMICALVASTGVQSWAMGNHSDVVRDQYGRALGGATITVYVAGTTELADIYSDDGITVKANPLTSDTLDGRYNFYAANGVYDIVLSHPNATFDAAHTARISVIDASNVGTGSGGEVTWAALLASGSAATSEVNPVSIRGTSGHTTTGWDIFTRTDGTPIIAPVCAGVRDACDKGSTLSSGYNFFVEDASGNRLLDFDPNAGTSTAQYALGTKKAKITLWPDLNPRGAASGGYESIVSNQPNDYYLTVTDANTDAADFTLFVTNRMAGATTATFRLVGVSKNASPANNIAFDCAMSTFTPGTDTYTAHVTTGEVRALLTPATQNRPVAVTTASHTINGGPLVAGDIVKGACEVHATDTTSAQLADFRLEGRIGVTLETNSLSE